MLAKFVLVKSFEYVAKGVVWGYAIGKVKKLGKPRFVFITKVFDVHPVKIATDDCT